MTMLTIRGYIMAMAFLFLLMAMFAVSGCNTVDGIGKDLQGAGQAIEETF